MPSAPRPWLACALGVTLASQAFAGQPGPRWGDLRSARRARRAIQQGADYAARVLLDGRGRSRCDYHLAKGTWHGYEPAWHTGQLINGLLAAYEVTKDSGHLRAATRAGKWWVGQQLSSPTRLRGMIDAVHGNGIGAIVFSTVSDGTPGLFRLSRVTGDPSYADVATEAGRWMLDHMRVPGGGLFYDAVDPRSGKVLRERSVFWPDRKHPSLNQVARPNNEGSLYRDIYRHTGDARFKKVFLELCDSLVRRQGPEGLWMDFSPNDASNGRVHPRFNVWYAESLLDGYDLTGNEKYLEAALSTGQAMARLQQPDGCIYYKNYLDGRSKRRSKCGSAVSFAGLLWLRLARLGHAATFAGHIERSVRWVLDNRYGIDHPDANLAGGFVETRVRQRDGDRVVLQRDIATSFGLRFLAEYLAEQASSPQ
jgi:rhamnogalacturonyl hydrolase YesR